jgi:hypothetical protein
MNNEMHINKSESMQLMIDPPINTRTSFTEIVP